MELKLATFNPSATPDKLLIVPYGIETKMWILMNGRKSLLIVPYGIETTFDKIIIEAVLPFNCTLWN